MGITSASVINDVATMATEASKSLEQMEANLIKAAIRQINLPDQRALKEAVKLQGEINAAHRKAAESRLRMSQGLQDRELANLMASLEQHKDARQEHFDEFVRQAKQAAEERRRIFQQEAADTLQSIQMTIDHNDRMAQSIDRNIAAISRSWEGFELAQQPIMQRLGEANVNFADLVEGLAERFGKSTLEMGQELEAVGVKFGDVMGLMQVQGEETLGAIIDQFEETAKAAESMAGRVALAEKQSAAVAAGGQGPQSVSLADIRNSLASATQRLATATTDQESQMAQRTIAYLANQRKQLFGFGHGGRSPGGDILVGEYGPEIVSPPGGSIITPVGAGGPVNVYLTVYGDVTADDLEDKVARVWLRRFNGGGFPQVARS